MLTAADVLAVWGGDPFHPLVVARRPGFAAAARESATGGALYVGYGAEAMLAGPTLEPLHWTSSRSSPSSVNLSGLGLADIAVLPRHEPSEGRSAMRQPRRSSGTSSARPVRDGVRVIQDGSQISVLRR